MQAKNTLNSKQVMRIGARLRIVFSVTAALAAPALAASMLAATVNPCAASPYDACRIVRDTVSVEFQQPDTVGVQPPDGKSFETEEIPFTVRRTPKFLAVKFSGGQVFHTNDFVSGKYAIPFYSAATVKFGASSRGDSWQDIAYGMPYYGLGFYTANFRRRENLGNPVSLYILQGATILQISPRIALNYEWNVGMSTGWKPYDPFTNRDNVAVGSDFNIHVGFALYLKWYLSSHLDLHMGAELTHFSNGAARMPNSGMNMYAVFVEASYNFSRSKAFDRYNPNLLPPDFEKHYVSDISLTISSRRISVDTVGTKLPSPYLDRKFTVLGFNYSLMYVPGYRYRYGAGVNFSYDESKGATAARCENPADGNWYDVVYKGRVAERFSLGVSAQGEVVLPGYSVFVNLGVQFYRGNKSENRLYQLIGVKIYLRDNLFGTFGVRANHFSAAQYIFWSLGYTLEHRRRR